VWRAGTKLAAITKKRLPVGPTFSFTLNERAQVSFAFTQKLPGRKVKGNCVAKRSPRELGSAKVPAGSAKDACERAGCKPSGEGDDVTRFVSKLALGAGFVRRVPTGKDAIVKVARDCTINEFGGAPWRSTAGVDNAS
jgi:hypothetical protein